MYFRAQLTADTHFDLSSKEPLTFQVTTPRGVDVSVVVRQDNSRGNVLIAYEESVNSETDELLSHWEANKWPEDEKGRKTLAAIFDRHRQSAYDTANHVLRVLRWRSGDITQNQELSQPASTYSRDGETWVSFPPPTPIGLPRPRIVREWNAGTIVDETTSVINDGFSWPVACELLQEAWNLIESAPRSAVVMGVGALEVAVKAFIAACVPKAKWLVEELPSPPVYRLLTEYMPNLAERNPCPPKYVRRILNEGIKLRNEIAHAGKVGPSYQEVQELLGAIEDTIWLIEWSGGLDRAWSFIWGKTQVDYLCEWLQQMVPVIPDLSDKEKQQLFQAIPSLLRDDNSTPNAIERLIEMRAKLPQQFMDSLAPHFSSKVAAELSPDRPPEPPKFMQFIQRLPRVPRIG